MSDSAKGPLAGYLFQFEKALLLISELENLDDFISIEEVDDIATHKEDGTVLLTIQAKHSISSSGTTFEDTSHALWRTLEIWIEKLQSGVFNEDTEFVCCTNKEIALTSLLYKIKDDSFENVIDEFKNLLVSQETKLKEFRENEPKAGTSIKKTIELIKFVLKNEIFFKIIKKNIKIEDNEDIKSKFLNRLNVGSDIFTDIQKDNFVHSFYGWVVSNSKAKWMNGTKANFSKRDFDRKWAQIISNTAIVNAVFRTKEFLRLPSETEMNKRKKDLFVRQIEDISRRQDAKERIIKEAILDFIYRDIELVYIIEKGDYTQEDFEQFLEDCRNVWQACFDSKVKYEIATYSKEQKNDLAIVIFDTIMNEIKMEFKDGFCFTTSNKYVKNGSFLKLSDIPYIGWHPEWDQKYK
jgi:hypothetical protein